MLVFSFPSISQACMQVLPIFEGIYFSGFDCYYAVFRNAELVFPWSFVCIANQNSEGLKVLHLFRNAEFVFDIQWNWMRHFYKPLNKGDTDPNCSQVPM